MIVQAHADYFRQIFANLDPNRIQEDGEFGGQEEIFALVSIFGRPIVIFDTRTNEPSIYNQTITGDEVEGDPIFILYNGIPTAEIYRPDGLTKLGIHAVPPIVTRGVLLDMAKYFGVEMVGAGTVFQPTDLKKAAQRQGVEIRTGDVVLLNTGWISLFETDPERSYSGMPSPGKDGARYLADLGVVAVGGTAGACPPMNISPRTDAPLSTHSTLPP